MESCFIGIHTWSSRIYLIRINEINNNLKHLSRNLSKGTLKWNPLKANDMNVFKDFQSSLIKRAVSKMNITATPKQISFAYLTLHKLLISRKEHYLYSDNRYLWFSCTWHHIRFHSTISERYDDWQYGFSNDIYLSFKN